MGLLYPRRDEDTSRPRTGPDSPPGQDGAGDKFMPHGLDPWLIIVIAIGVVIVTTLALFMLVHCIRSRRRRGDVFQPVEEMSGLYARKGKLSSEDQQKLDDLERDRMIRKSLASRPTSASISQVLLPPEGDARPEHRPEEDQGEIAASLRDWKAWEARTQGEGTHYPAGVGLDQHPAFASYLAVPPCRRTDSPARGVGGANIDRRAR
ncbi:hypothetical protein F4802DRAFT_476372 [Xylaria palmicola]|nr:hypothetical protein F4802DRAFT_476372 [Xylaria palmicola]